MPIDPNATAKSYDVIIYNKTEINDMNTLEQDRVNTELDDKISKQALASPIGVATLGATGKVSLAQMDFADLAQSGDSTNSFTAMTPERTLYQINQNTIPPSEVGSANGLCPLDGNSLVDPVYLPPAQIVQTFVVDLLTDMYALAPVNEGDRCVVTAEVDPADNGEYVAKVDILVAPSTSADWDLLPNLSSVQSVNGETGDVTITKANTPDIATNEADILTNSVAITANDARMTAERTFRTEIGVDVDTIIALGEHAVTDNLPLNADGVQYVEGIITVYGDERTVVDGNGYVQLFWNGAIVTDGALDGAYIARATADAGTTWSAWEFEPVFTDADYFDFNPQTPPLTHKEGRFFYDNNSKTHVSYTDIVGVSRNLGEQFDVRSHNATGSQLVNGKAVKGAGSSTSGNPNLIYANTTTFANARAQGVLTNDMDNGNDGYATVIGSVGIDTTDVTLFDWSPVEGDDVYLNDAGTYSNARSLIFSYIGQITVAGVDGKILVKPTTVEPNPQFGGFINMTTTTIFNLSAVPVAVQGYDTADVEGIVADATVGTLSPIFSGLYNFNVTLHGTATLNKEIVTAQLWDLTNAAEVTNQILSTDLGGNNGGAISFSFEARIVAGEEFILRLFTDGTAFDFNMNQCQFSLKSTKIDTGI